MSATNPKREAVPDYDKLSDRALLDLGFERLKLKVCPLYLDDNAARLVRDRIAELELQKRFVLLLGPLTKTNSYQEQIFAIMQLPPRQQMIAALKSLEPSGERTE